MTNLTNAQLLVIKTWVVANRGGVFDQATADALNQPAAGPNNVCWKTVVSLARIANALNGAELGGLTTANHTRLQTVITLIGAAGGANPSDSDQRAFWDDIFSGAGGTLTRAGLLLLWKRAMTVGEALLKTGTGSDASPAVLGLTTAADGSTGYAEGPVTLANVEASEAAA